MTRFVLLAAVLAALLLAACSSTSPAPAAPASTASATAAAASPAPGCASALAELPKSAPDTVQQATADYDALSGGIADTTAASIANDVGADSFKIMFDLSEHLSVTSDIAQWQADSKALRSYCG